MTITIFVKPDCLSIFLKITALLEKLPLENDYVFQPRDISFTESMLSNYVWVNMEVEEYLKLKYCIGKLS